MPLNVALVLIGIAACFAAVILSPPLALFIGGTLCLLVGLFRHDSERKDSDQ